MTSGAPSPLSPRDRLGAIERFQAELAREGIRPLTASFSDKHLEAEYQNYLYGAALPALRAFCVGGPVVWFLFGILDILTIKEGFDAVALVRWAIVGPLGVALTLALFSERLKRYYGWVIAAGMLAFALGIIAMIVIMPIDGAPPYIIGILVTFAYASCFMRISFPLALTVYGVSTLVYCGMLAGMEKFPQVEVIAGYFFMINIAIVAILTHYWQEVRSRQIWKRNRQRALDAAFIEELLIEATAADQSKLNFISVLSHELRTPLHQIIGFSEVVMQRVRDGEPEDSDEFLDNIRTSAFDLLSRIAKMLRYADATAGKIKYEIEEVSACDVVDTVLVQAKTAAAARAIEIDVAGVADRQIRVDHPHTSYAVGHIVENAIKASKRNATVWIHGDIDEGGDYVLVVEDKGAGMTEAEIKAAFEPFSQIEQVRTRSLDGIGLGLTLARKIFSDQGAELSIQSAKGEGTSVSIRFPAAGRDMLAPAHAA